MKKALIILDNGHGENTKGKCSPDAYHLLVESPYYLKEYAYTREIAHEIYESLNAHDDIDCVLLVPELKDISLSDRVNRANVIYLQNRNKYEKILLVSIHCNAAGNGSDWLNARGWTAFTSVGLTQSDYACRYLYEAADMYLKDYIRNFSSPDKKQRPIRDTKDISKGHERDFTILKYTKCPAVLTENLFQDNKFDVAFLKSQKGKDAIIDLHIAGILGWVYNSSSVPVIVH